MAIWNRSTMDMKLEFVQFALAGDANVRELCRRYKVSPTTAYKWLERYRAAGVAGLVERSRRPHGSPRRSPAAVEAAVLAMRKERPAWGGRKIAFVLKRDKVCFPAPAPSTVTDILRRHGVALGDPVSGPPATGRFEHAAPNDLWQMDFKGHVGLRNGGRCHPLTALDDHSRFNLETGACPDERRETVENRLVPVFERYGIPKRIAFDNGAPWGSSDQSRFTAFTVWLIEHDIAVSHSRPRHPQTLGKDERFHRTLKAEAMACDFTDLAEAEAAFRRFRHRYNHERPHEALGMAVPASRYAPSTRPWREKVEPFEYGPDDALRRVDTRGKISFRGKEIRISKAFDGKTIALRPTALDGEFDVVFRSTKVTTLSLNSPQT